MVSPPHPWAGRWEVAPRELTGMPLLMREQGSATRLVTEVATLDVLPGGRFD